MVRAVIACWREPIESWKRLAPIVVPFLIIVAVTDIGYFFRDVGHARHLVFFYLLPTAFVAMLYGSVLSMIFAIDATFIAGLSSTIQATAFIYLIPARQVSCCSL